MSNLNKVIIGIIAAVIVGGGLGYAAIKTPMWGKTVAQINGKNFTMEDIEREISHVPPALQMALQDQEGKRRFLDRLVDRELLLQEARRQGLEQSSEVKEKLAELQDRINEYRQTMVLEALLTKELEEKVKVSDEELNRYLQARSQQVNVRHILVPTEAEAQSLLERINRGESFEKLAQAHSLDPGSKGRGGEIGFFSRGHTVGDFEEAAFKLQPGEVAGPIKTEYGYHLLKLVARKQVALQELEKIREKARESLREEKQKQALKKLLEDLRAKAKVRIKEEAFKAQAEAPAGKAPAHPAVPGKAQTR